MMMKNCVIFLIVLLALSSCGKQSKECVLIGDIDTELDGKLTIYPADCKSMEDMKKNSIHIDIVKGKFERTIDSTFTFRNGTMSLGDKSMGSKMNIDFFSESGRIIFSGKPGEIKISGTLINDDYSGLKKRLKHDSYQKLKYKHELSAEEQKLKDTYVENLWKEAMRNPSSLALTYMFNSHFFGADVEQLKKIANVFSKEIHHTKYLAKMLKRLRLAESLSIGKIAPEFTLSTVEGEKVSLSDYRGKYLLIDFWASWCGPCRRAIPEVKKVYEAFNKQGLEVINISTDRDPKAWLKAVNQEQMPWKQVRDTENVSDLYDIIYIPSIFLIDTEGKIAAKKLHGQTMWEALEKAGFKK